jgi:pyruvate/2-oxoglutarate dehydrogenase complex dihydrolipoamide acyltransferase (E2) component
LRRYLARVDAVLVQAVIAGALSFAHLHDLAAAAGQHGWKAWAYPISVDLLMVVAWRRLRSGHATTAGWCWFVIALAASLGANVATAGLLDLTDVPAWLRILVAGWPAVAFLGGTLLAHSPSTAAPDEPKEDAAELPAAADPEPDPTPEPARPAAPAPALPAAPAVPAALVEHARKVADAHRARTGTPIDTDTLRTRLGVPLALADAIAIHLSRGNQSARPHHEEVISSTASHTTGGT